MPAQQCKVGQRLDALRTVAVLRDAHAIDYDRALSLHVDLRGIFDVAACKAGTALDVGPLGGLQIADERFDSERMTADEIPIQNLRLSARTCGFVRFHQN